MTLATTAASSFGITSWRLLAAMFVIPLFDAGLGYASFPVVWWLGNHGGFRPIDPQQAAFAFGIVNGVLGLLVMLAAALPVTFWLVRQGHTSVGTFALAGALIGNLPFAAYLYLVVVLTFMHLAAGTLAQHLASPAALLVSGLRGILIGSATGALSGIMFWLIAVRRWSSEVAG
jgi:hypothetical protein